jgi:uncharacterized cupredoxin-like copper-binding protein
MAKHGAHRWPAWLQRTRIAVAPALAVLLAGLAGCGSTAVAPPSPPAGTSSAASGTPQVTLSEFKVDAPTTLKAGQVSLKITNGGSMEHELLVFKSDLDPSQYPTDSDGNIQEDGAGITKDSDGDNITPGNSQQRTVDLSKPGKYLFLCNLPSHFKQGMATVVTVTP